MVSSRKKRRHQKVVYWAAAGLDNYGEKMVSAAIELLATWELSSSEVLTPGGETIVTQIFCLVDRTIPDGSIFWKGALADLPDPLENNNLYRSVLYEEIPDVKGKNPERSVRLIRHSQTLPTVEP